MAVKGIFGASNLTVRQATAGEPVGYTPVYKFGTNREVGTDFELRLYHSE